MNIIVHRTAAIPAASLYKGIKSLPGRATSGGMHPGRNELCLVFLHFAKHLFCEHFLILCQGNVINSGKNHIRVDALLLVLCAYSERLCKDKVKLP